MERRRSLFLSRLHSCPLVTATAVTVAGGESVAIRTVTQSELQTPLVPYDEARQIVQAAVRVTAPAITSIVDALDSVLAEDVIAPFDVPRFDNSAMDGYAVDSAGTAVASPQRPFVIDSTVKIATGGPIPATCDAVVPWERTRRDGNDVLIDSPVGRAVNVRRAGAEVRAGSIVLRVGERLSPVHLGILGALGRSHVSVRRRPRVAIASTGGEVAAQGAPLGAHQVYDSNRFFLQAMVQRAGGMVVTTALLPDDPDEIEAWMTNAAAQADIVITTGGASVGERDWCRHVLTQRGELLLWHVSIKPGKPIAFGRLDGAHVFVLPGNPGSAFACAHAFVMPALRAMSGAPFDPSTKEGHLSTGAPGDRTRTSLCPVKWRDGEVTVLHGTSSQLLTPYLQADGLVALPAGGLRSGARVLMETWT